MLRALVVSLTPLLLPAHASAQAQEARVYVDGSRSEGLLYEGKAFSSGQSWIEAQGVGRAVFTEDHVLSGDFRIDTRLTLMQRNATAAALQLGESYFGFDGKGNSLFLNGSLFGPAVEILGSADAYIESGKTFELSVRRVGGRLTVDIDGQVVLEREVGDLALGRFGLRPHRGLLRVHHLAASGAIGQPPARDRKELQAMQPAIDVAIDEGVEYLLRTQHRDGSWGDQAVKFFGGMTALSTYTLLKCGLDTDHPAVRQALLHLEQVEPHEVYTVAFLILALEATGEAEYLPRIEALAEALMEWQVAGSWGYPYGYSNGWTNEIDRSDLSNVQLAVLGLRAASKAGVKVPRKVWERTIAGTLAYRSAEERVTTNADRGRTATTPVAGFGYKDSSAPYGSMTAAGVAILTICKAELGKRLSGRSAREVDHAIRSGVAWLDVHFSATENPGKGSWLYYYLYGLERIGALLGTERIGEHLWYLEGAESLLARRANDGSWYQKVREADTCFALLFLKRATAPSSGSKVRRTQARQFESPGSEVHLRTTGVNPVTVWVTGFGKSVQDEFGYRRSGPRVVAVEYLRDGEVVARVEGDPRRGWSGERYAAKLDFERRGSYRLNARVQVVEPDEPEDMIGQPVTLEAQGFSVDVSQAWEDEMQRAAQLRGTNLLVGYESRCEASSEWAPSWSPDLACDGIESTAWLCAANDEDPFLSLHLGRGLRAQALVLGTVGSSALRAEQFDRILSVDVVVNDKDRYPIRFDVDSLRAARLEFEQRVRVKTLRIENIVREPGAKYPGGCGFSEVALIAAP